MLPYSIEAEQSVLGCVLYDNQAMSTTASELKASDFYNEQYRLVYGAMLDLYTKNLPIDIITLADRLRSEGVLEALGGVQFLTELADILSTPENVEQYCAIVKEKSMLRQLITRLSKVIEDSYDSKEEAQKLIFEAEKDILEIVTTQEKRGGFVSFEAALQTVLARLQQAAATKNRMTGIPTGFVDLDRMTNGLQESDLIILAGRPGMGKTSLGINICQHAAIRENRKTAVFSLEMPLEQLTMRILASEANISFSTLRNATMNDFEWKLLYNIWNKIMNSPLYIDDTPGITVNEIRAKCRRMKAREGLDLIMVDYLQLIQGVGRRESRQQEISQISRDLKLLAKELNCPVITLSQLNREPEKRKGMKPLISDLRESGAIEQDADIILFLYRNAGEEEQQHQEVLHTTLSIAKHRNGPTGEMDLMFQQNITTFRSAEQDDEEE